jgi:hypothetical protein
MKFIQITSVCILILIFSRPSQAQNHSTDLREVTWYCNCDFKTDSLAIFPSNTANYRFRLNFSPDGRLLLFDLKSKISNTTFSYTLKKSTLNIFYNSKDSLADLNYLIRKNKETKSFDLSLYYDMRYKKLKASDKPPVGKFTLSKGKKTVTFEKMEEITVYRTKKGLKHDSIEMISKGNFLEIRNDTLVLNAFQFSVHNFYKNYPDTNHYFSESLDDTLIRIKSPINEITKIYSQREEFNRVVNTAAIAALGVFFVSFPLAITIESSEAGSTFGQIAAFSALSIPVIISFNMAFSKRKFQIAPTAKNKEIWRLDYKK